MHSPAISQSQSIIDEAFSGAEVKQPDPSSPPDRQQLQLRKQPSRRSQGIPRLSSSSSLYRTLLSYNDKKHKKSRKSKNKQQPKSHSGVPSSEQGSSTPNSEHSRSVRSKSEDDSDSDGENKYDEYGKHGSRNRLGPATLAATFVSDAMHGLRVDITPPERNANQFIAWITKIHRHRFAKYIICTVAFLHCMLLFWENEPSEFDQQWNISTMWIQVCCLLVYITDIIFGVLDYGLSRYFQNRWGVLYMIVVMLLTVEVIVSLLYPWVGYVPHIHVLRMFRPWIFLFKLKSLRALVITMANVIPHISHTLLLGAMIAAIYALIGMAVFRNLYDDPFQNFDDFWNSSMAMIVLFTTENFPDIVIPSLMPKPINSAIFFCSFISIGVWIYMALLLAVIYDYYQKCHENQVLATRVNEQEAMVMAFSILNEQEEMYFPTFRQLMKALRPSGSCHFDLVSLCGVSCCLVLYYLACHILPCVMFCPGCWVFGEYSQPLYLILCICRY